MEVIRCKECIYWRNWHVLLKDGKRRGYLPEELNEHGFGSINTSVGCNVSPQCTRDSKFAQEEGVNIPPVFRNENDFCSKAVRGKPQFSKWC